MKTVLRITFMLFVTSSVIFSQENQSPFPKFTPYVNIQDSSAQNTKTDMRALGMEQPARWLSVDPLADKYPGWSPYNYCSNNPTLYIDPNGMEWYYYQGDDEKEKKWHYHEDTPEMKIWTGGYDKDGNKIMQATKGILELLTFDGKELNWLHANGITEGWTAVSGILDQNGNTQPEMQFMKGGPIPEGWYKVDPSRTLSIYDAGNLIDLVKWVAKYPSWGSYNTPIMTSEGSLNYNFNRSNAFIHGGISYGSAGCIDLAMNNAAFFGAFQGHGKVLPLNVNYSRITPQLFSLP